MIITSNTCGDILFALKVKQVRTTNDYNIKYMQRCPASSEIVKVSWTE